MTPAAAATPARRSGARTWATLLAGAVALAVIAAPGSMAYLQTQASTGGVTLTTGTAELEIGPGSGAAPQLVPDGQLRLINSANAATITNSGDVPLALGVSLAASDTTPSSFGSATLFVVWLSPGACVVPTALGPGIWAGRATTPVATSIGTLAPGAQQQLCLAAGLDVSAPAAAGTSGATTFTVTVTGTQVAS